MDRLSELPDSVLCHILSFLPTEDSVKTNILAKRWRFLWTYVPNLDFNNRWVGEEVPGLTFSDVVNKVMLLHNVQNLNTFRLEYTEDDLNGYELETWITTAIFRKVQNLNLCLDYETILPRCLVTCKTLVDMRLWGCAFELLSPTSVHLPSLRKLHLHYITFTNDDTFSCLISGCPVLEELLIDEIKEDDLVCLRISSPTLKWIKFYSLALDNSYNYEIEYTLELNAPALEYINLHDFISKSISADPVPKSLIEANICFSNNEDDVADNELYYDSVLEFVYKLRHVKSLKLSFRYMRFVESVISASTVRFQNLTKLQLIGDWRLVSKFIENADLSINEFLFNQVHEDFKCWLDSRQVPNCLLSHQTSIKFCNYRDSESEVEMVRYILRNALVLKRMEIYVLQDFDEARKFSALQKISLMPRGSATCEVAFYSNANYQFK